LDYFVKAGKASKEYNVEMFCIAFGIELITTELNTVRVLCWLGQEDLLGQEDFDCNMIIPAFKQIIKIAPDHVEAYNSIAYAYKEIDDYKQAITYLKQAVSIDPNYANGYDSLGEMYYDIEDNEQAIKYFKKAISLNPDLAVSYYNLGNTYLRINDNKQAIENYRKAAQLEYADAQDWLRNNGIGW
jgi:tetratricopeptide (TPR) repeat protein